MVDKGNVWSTGGLVLTNKIQTYCTPRKTCPVQYVHHKSCMDLGGINPGRQDENLAMDHPETWYITMVSSSVI